MSTHKYSFKNHFHPELKKKKISLENISVNLILMKKTQGKLKRLNNSAGYEETESLPQNCNLLKWI